jgi:hypothetical protein
MMRMTRSHTPHSFSLERIVADFAWGIMAADSKRPQAVNLRSGTLFSPGIGPHTESRTVELVLSELVSYPSSIYSGLVELEVPYPDSSQTRCDVCIGTTPAWIWAIEVKMLRLMGDNGKPNDNMLMHILSPYPSHHSALTDCEKLVNSSLGGRKAIIIFAYDSEKWPAEIAVASFERLASERVRLSTRATADFSDLVRPIHRQGRVFGWEIRVLYD